MPPDATFFAAAPQRPHALSEGSCDLPIHYRDGSWCGLFYRVDLEAARALMKGLSIEPMPILGAATAAVYAWEYRDSSVGSYGEVGLGIQARRVGSRPSVVGLGWDMSANDDQGIWVVTLPVTTEAAFRAGVELWGYPKYVTPIETRFDDHGARVRLGDELTLSLGGVRGMRRGLPVVTYTSREGTLVRTSITTAIAPKLGLPRDGKIEIHGAGRTADAARALGMDSRAPIAAFHTNRFVATLPIGKDLGPIR